MTDQKDLGVITVLLERLEKERLPRALSLKARVDQGEKLQDTDIDFLEKVFADATAMGPQMDKMVQRNPQYEDLVSRLLDLYHAITEKALENEQKQG